jgi:serine/threonine protein kinase/tetratricopeptide (TPR) repeat protein
MSDDPPRPDPADPHEDETIGPSDPHEDSTIGPSEPDEERTTRAGGPSGRSEDSTLSAGQRRSTAVPSRPADPEQIGQYRVLGRLGAGGMGVVFEAEQQSPKRPVAVKVIRGGRYVDETVVKMFQREAQTLARLKHPSIAAIYESGRTEDGEHFFAMELVRGQSLNDYLDARQDEERMPHAELRARLELFRKVCDGVAYAHQRGVIHRDLKPSNILVLADSERAGDSSGATGPEIKILDFGLARIVDTEVGAGSVLTQAGTIQGTLAYMSPEQVTGNTDEIDLRTDVYSLGVILYEMLTGNGPYDVQGSAIHEAARMICELPPRPLGKSWPGGRKPDRDLETIVQKALEKEPGDRYQSVNALAGDIERFLTNQPILARPPTTLYQLRKMVARRKLPFAFAGSVLVLIATLAVVMTVQAGRIAAERDRANYEAESARQVSKFLVELFEVSDPSEALGNTITAREILDRGAKKIPLELADQPRVQGHLMHTIGEVYRRLGLYDDAGPLLEKATAILEKELGEEHGEVAPALERLGTLLSRKGEYEMARPLYERALEIYRRDLGPEHTEVASVLSNLGTLSLRTGDTQAAQAYYQSASNIWIRALGPDHPDVAKSLNNLAILYRRTGQTVQARSMYERALRIFENRYGPDHPDVAKSLNNLASLLKSTGELESAKEFYERSLAIRERVLGPEHPDVALNLNNLGNLHEATGDHRRARECHERALAIREKTLGPEHSDVAQSLNNLGITLKNLRDYDEARRLYERALAIRVKALGPDHPKLGNGYYNLAGAVALQQDRIRALDLLREAADRGFTNPDVMNDADFTSLHRDPEFQRIAARIAGDAGQD